MEKDNIEDNGAYEAELAYERFLEDRGAYEADLQDYEEDQRGCLVPPTLRKNSHIDNTDDSYDEYLNSLEPKGY